MLCVSHPRFPNMVVLLLSCTWCKCPHTAELTVYPTYGEAHILSSGIISEVAHGPWKHSALHSLDVCYSLISKINIPRPFLFLCLSLMRPFLKRS